MSRILYQLYQPCGLFNQVISLELAVGLSHRYKKELLIHNISNPPGGGINGERVPIYSANYNFTDRGGLLDLGVYPKISDLLVWKNKDSTVLMDDPINIPDSALHIEDMLYSYSSNVKKESEEEILFSEGRSKLPVDVPGDISLKRTLGYYSRFFFNRDSELDSAIA